MEVVVENNKKNTMERSRFGFSSSNNNNEYEDSSSLRLGAHVLAVDDSLVDRKVIEKLLKITSCKVTAVDSGRRALQFLGLDGEEKPKQKPKEEEEERAGKEKEVREVAEKGEEEERKKRCVEEVEEDGLKIDLIITDYCMPEMTGYELLKKIKESSSLREIPVVIMSSENIVARIHRCLEEGAEDFIVKPVKLSDVKRLVECLMSSIRDDRANNNKTSSTPTAEDPLPPNGSDTSNKRKQPDGSDISPFSSSASEISGLSSSSSFSSSETSPSPSPLVSPADSTLTSPSQSPPPSPTRVVGELIPNSPTRKVRQTSTTTTTLICDQSEAAAASAAEEVGDDDVADVPASPL